MATPPRFLFLFLVLFLLPFSLVATADNSTSAKTATPNPFTAKAALIRYWNRKVPNGRPLPAFLVSKLSPLSALDTASFSSLAASGGGAALSPRLPDLCAAARLLCSPSLSSSNASHPSDSAFAGYSNSNFSNYGADRAGGADSFKNYSASENSPIDTFRRYSRDSVGHDDSFALYQPDGNIDTANFTSYATAATGGAGDFSSYAHEGNVPDLKFTNYEADANGRVQKFSSYSDDTNSGGQSFAGYGKHGNGIPLSFTSYGSNSNVMNSDFNNYGEDGNGANDTFTNYGQNGNVPENNFRSYGGAGNAASEKFSNYRDQANVGDDSFTSYAKEDNAGAADFKNYGNSFNQGTDSFKGYGQGSINFTITFGSYYGDNTTFKAYAKTGIIGLNGYHNSSTFPSSAAAALKARRRPTSRWVVEPGKFFRESELKKGTVMPMPDISDRMPARSFLPRSIAGRIPFSAAEVQRVFNMPADTALGKAAADTVAECERPPSRGETKRCATSAEDVIDFAVSVLGNNVVVRSTENTHGSKGSILIGEVKGVNGGSVTKSVSCHQSLFPYLVYYCHSVPKVRVYQAEILTVKTKEKINHGVAICHVDTSDWSPAHGAFVALGPGPGKIEVCHWIFKGDMTWTVAD
ncbi:BURP domain-containing protein 12-like [Phoenix dactylifera]|uniref:BURP domain-containing protein 12-like n=1 Tax=Phoenix dactylifera TaxID=42345 RepID=A0A8B8ZPR1_PHODC|nr:BURP domain-containing protein 12-like [Phoenix dactylifera]